MLEPRGPDKDPFQRPGSRKDDESKQIIGERILGNINPQILTREEFERSPDLLFHGSSKPFTFSRSFDYQSPDYLAIDCSSVTLGFGFYATDRENASDYSEVRAHFSVSEIQPHVTTILPYQARCLDLRLKSNPLENAPLPGDLVEKWIEYYKASTQNPSRYKDLNPSIAYYLQLTDREYLDWLSKITEEQAVNLKRLLRTNQYPGPYWMYTFREFMLSQGYDCLIINEGSEKAKDKSVTSYVFYNLDKIGTYETWHQEQEVTK